VTLVARDEAALKSAAATLPGDGHSWHAVDVTDRGAWASLPLGDMSGLVCAAALLEPIGPIGSYDIDAFRRTMDVNVVGTLLAIEACLPALRAAGGSIVTFSGGGATSPLPNFDAYAASKAAVVRLTENLSPAIAPVAINAVAPGFVATEIHQATLDAGPELVGHAYYERTRADLAGGGFPAEDAARLVAMLLDRPPFTGKLISAQWDPWQDSVFISRLAAENDLGTLRRIDDQFFVRVADE
jgi:3-oxoacyl-[acyl-carrier protein] reductase